MAFPPEWMEELTARNSLVEIAGKSLKLERKGRAWWACCPFHHEKTPSFRIDDAMNLYYCFGCHAGGDVIKFVQNIENIDFLDAVKFLAERAHMTLPETIDDKSVHLAKEKKDRLLALLKEAARHYHENLWAQGGTAAREYLERRGVNRAWAVRFGLGASLGWTEMTDYLYQKGFVFEEMKEAGLAGRSEKDGRYFETFANRVMFPIINGFGDVVSFGGRTLEKNPEARKYLNGAQTAVFDKSKLLYAVNLLRKKKQSATIPYVIIVEGYMDVISLHAAGFESALANMGTALTAPQARILKNYSDKVFVCYDGDSAGINATLRGLDILSAAGLDVRVVTLPDKLDPDDAVKKFGAEGFMKFLEKADGLVVYKLKTLKADSDMARPAGRAKYAREAAQILRGLSPVEQEEYLKIVKEETGYSMDSLKRQLAEGQMTNDKGQMTMDNGQNTGFLNDDASAEEPAVKCILFAQLTRAGWADNFDAAPYIRTEAYKIIDGYIKECVKENRPPRPSAILDLLQDYAAEANAFLNADYRGGGDYYEECKRGLQRHALLDKINGLSRSHDAESDLSEKSRIAREIAALNVELIKLKNKN